MIVGIGRDPRFELGGVDLGRGLGQLERRARPRDVGMTWPPRRARVEQRARLVGLAAGDQRPRQPADHGRILRRHVVDLPEDRAARGRIALGKHLLAHRDQRLDLGLLLAPPRP